MSCMYLTETMEILWRKPQYSFGQMHTAIAQENMKH